MHRFSRELDSFFDGISLRTRLARASELVSAGAFQLAEEALCPGAYKIQTHQEYDLLARIRFYQGRDDRARELWQKAQQIGGTSNLYAQEIHLLDEYEVYKRTRKRLTIRFISVVLGVLFLTFIVYLFWSRYQSLVTYKKPALTVIKPSASPQFTPTPSPEPIPSPSTTPASLPSIIKDNKKPRKGPTKLDKE